MYDNKPNFTAGVFLVPKGNSIPLHNHPKMLVVTKLIWGNILIKNYDRTINDKKEVSHFNDNYDCFKVKPKEDILLKQDDISILTPFSNNIHQIHAMEDSAFFDIILPAYDEENERECDYFELMNVIDRDKEGLFMRKI